MSLQTQHLRDEAVATCIMYIQNFMITHSCLFGDWLIDFIHGLLNLIETWTSTLSVAHSPRPLVASSRLTGFIR